VEIAGNFGDEPADIEKARLRLAKAVLSMANSRDVDVLKNAALQRMALNYRDGTPTKNISGSRPPEIRQTAIARSLGSINSLFANVEANRPQLPQDIRVAFELCCGDHSNKEPLRMLRQRRNVSPSHIE
jgi:hypothetical protein